MRIANPLNQHVPRSDTKLESVQIEAREWWSSVGCKWIIVERNDSDLIRNRQPMLTYGL
ncbi:hypothetical protein D3C71_2137030 [compost metagenome]